MKSIIIYTFVGALTTALNIAAYYFFSSVLLWNYIVANIFAWIISVLFAFLANRKYVFSSQNNESLGIIKEFSMFWLGRLATGALDIGLMYLLVSVACVNDKISKIIVNFLVIILNYIISKFIVFKNY